MSLVNDIIRFASSGHASCMQVWTNILSRISSDSPPSDAELLLVAQQADELAPIDQPLCNGDLLSDTVTDAVRIYS